MERSRQHNESRRLSEALAIAPHCDLDLLRKLNGRIAELSDERDRVMERVLRRLMEGRG